VRTLGVFFALVALAGCSATPVDLGRDPEVLWWTDHETGDLSDWQEGSHSSWIEHAGTLGVDESQARSGRFSLDASAAAAPSGTTSAAMLLRTGGLPQAAYYSAWFYVPTGIATAGYWLIFKFRSRAVPDDPTTDVETWDIDLTPQASDVQIVVFQHTSSTDPVQGMMLQPLTTLPIPFGRWFQVEAFLRAANDASGELMLWQDGVLLFDLHGPSAPSAYVQWSAGSAAQSLSSGTAQVHVDDAAVSLRQLGPDSAPFWRGE